jgi:predicted MFS family arabinose efflux permease
MSPVNRFRALCYAIEGINSFAIAFFFGYLFFFFRDRYGFNDRQNLLLAALAGLVYSVAAWQAGRFAQRRGCFTALKFGFGVMAASLALGWSWHSVAGGITAACLVNAGVCFIWPSLEALVSEGDAPEHVPHAVGLYNITWAVTNAAAFFIGGTLIKKLGYDGLFGLPLALMLVQFGMTFWLEKIHPPPPPACAGAAQFEILPPPLAARAGNFQRMAWLANPSAYIAINTLIAVLPGIALKFHLSTMQAGFALTIWCFVRFFTFIALWRWTAWHYRFRWLVTSFALLIFSFVTILVAPNLMIVLLAQTIFGMSIGLIYYSSLFYSMDASETKGEQGGIHEAAIGIGNCLGPAMGATALWLAPTDPSIGAWAVSGLLSLGFAGLCWVRSSSRTHENVKV